MVKVTSERIPDSQVLVSIEVEPERVDESVERAYRSIAGRLTVPGFRRGKAPRHLVERVVGREAIFADGVERLINDVYKEAIGELDLHPIDQPNIELEPKLDEIKPGDAIRVKATVPVRPVVELGDYRSVSLSPVDVDVTPEQVNEVVDRLQEQSAEWRPVERAAKQGDRVLMDVKGETGTYTRLYSPSGEPMLQTGTGQSFVDETGVEFELDPASSRYPKGVVEQIIGVTPEQEKKFEISLPSDYPDPELANKSVMFTVRVEAVKEKYVPPIEEVATDSGYETVEAMRDGVRERLLSRAQSEAQTVFENSVLTEIVSNSSVEIPPVMIEDEVNRLIERVRERAGYQGLDLRAYLEAVRKNEDELRAEMRDTAVENIKNALVLTEIGQREGVQVESEEVESQIQAEEMFFRQISGDAATDVRTRLNDPSVRHDIEHRIWHRKVIALLTKIAEENAGKASTEAPSGDAPSEGDAASEPDLPAETSETAVAEVETSKE